VAFALQADGWYLRSDIIWHKQNPMPESVNDRPTKAHEYVFLLTKSEKYFYDADAIREKLKDSSIARGNYPHNSFGKGQFSGSPTDKRNKEGKQVKLVSELQNPLGRNKRSVWTIPTQPYSGAHYATFPEALPTTCILAGCPPGGVVLDPFIGSGTTGQVAQRLGRRWIGFDIDPRNKQLIEARTAQRGLFGREASG